MSMTGIWIKMKETNLTVQHEIDYTMVVQLEHEAFGVEVQINSLWFNQLYILQNYYAS